YFHPQPYTIILFSVTLPIPYSSLLFFFLLLAVSFAMSTPLPPPSTRRPPRRTRLSSDWRIRRFIFASGLIDKQKGF
ncbi:hypothetical protein LINPERPRIM_LOCUS42792, partial [Linum perenne]